MKFLIVIILILVVGALLAFTIFKDRSSKMIEPKKSIFTLSFTDLEGGKHTIEEFKGTPILFVNTASECGFTPQYEELQKLHDDYQGKVTIIGFPCNQFGGQEPGTASDIGAFCQKNYGVTFLMAEKIDVKGAKQHPIYKWLCSKAENGKLDSSVKWNFQKYLLDAEGRLIDVFYSTTSPLSEKITSHL